MLGLLIALLDSLHVTGFGFPASSERMTTIFTTSRGLPHSLVCLRGQIRVYTWSDVTQATSFLPGKAAWSSKAVSSRSTPNTE